MLELTLRLVASLALVVGLLLLVVRIGGRRFQGRASAPVRVVHRQALTRSSAVAIIEVGGRMIVVGATDQQVSMLTELDPDTLDAIEPEGSSERAAPPAPATPATPATFTPLLRRVIQPAAAAAAPAAPPSSPESAPTSHPGSTFDGASFAAHLDSAVRSLRPTTPSHTASPVAAPTASPTASPTAATAAVAAAGAARAARGAETFSLLDLLDAAEDVVEISATGSHLAPTGTDAVVTALPVPVTPPATPAPGARLRTGNHAAAPQAGRPRAGRRLATREGDRPAPAPVRDDGPLAGSILSPGTWKQAAAAARGGRR